MSEKTTPKTKKSIKMIAAVLSGVLVLAMVIFADIPWTDVFAFLGLETNDGLKVDGEVTVTVLDVGQGDCIVIQAGETTVMIDAGDRGAQEEIIAFLDANDIKRIDYLLVTHPHKDHIGGMPEVIEHCEIGRVLFSYVPENIIPPGADYKNLLGAIDKYHIPSRIAEVGEKIALDRGLLTVLFAGGYSDLNNCSLVVRYDYGEASFLFTGDAEMKVENFLLTQDVLLTADVLKAGHHGSQYATSEEFLEAVAPKTVAASMGMGNSYKHPHRPFVDRVAAWGATLLRTDLSGNLVFVCDGGEPVYQPSQEKAA